MWLGTPIQDLELELEQKLVHTIPEFGNCFKVNLGPISNSQDWNWGSQIHPEFIVFLRFNLHFKTEMPNLICYGIWIELITLEILN